MWLFDFEVGHLCLNELAFEKELSGCLYKSVLDLLKTFQFIDVSVSQNDWHQWGLFVLQEHLDSDFTIVLEWLEVDAAASTYHMLRKQLMEIL